MRFINFIIAVAVCISAASAKNPQTISNPVGLWKFETPYAPEGFTTGIIEVGFADNKYSATINFPQADYRLQGERVKLENDTLLFSVWVEGDDVNINLKMESNVKMTGKAVYSEGEIPLTLIKEEVRK